MLNPESPGEWIACADRLPPLAQTDDGESQRSPFVLIYTTLWTGHVRTPWRHRVVAQLVREPMDEHRVTYRVSWQHGETNLYLDLSAVTHWAPLLAPPVMAAAEELRDA